VSLAQVAVPLAVMVGAGAQTMTGIGFSLICAPLLALALGGGDGVRLTNLLGIAVNTFMLAREWRGVMAGRVLTLAGPAVVAALLTAAAIQHATESVLSVATGLLVLAAVGAIGAGLRARRLAHWHGALLAGAASGAMTVVSGIGGPAVATYAANAEWPLSRLRPTLAAYFLAVNLVTVAARGVGPMTVTSALSLALALAVGFAGGAALSRRLEPSAVWRGTLILAAIGGVGAVLRGLL
jgi:uncharacterized membrane protein YfcA